MKPWSTCLAIVILLLATPSPALEVADIGCICADDARNHGDYVACVAHFSRRLVVSGQITARERQALVRDAAHQEGVPAVTCVSGPPRWGVGVQTDLQVRHPGETARIEGILWNFTPDHVTGSGSADGSDDGPDECLFALELQDDFGQTVHREDMPCPRAGTEYPMQSGRVRRLAVDIELVYLQSSTGELDGTPLDPGQYRLRLDVLARHPNRTPTPDGLQAEAEVLLRVEP